MEVEAIIMIIGLLGTRKTTLLKHLMENYNNIGPNPFIVLNDYENTNLGILQLINKIDLKWIRTLTSNCIFLPTPLDEQTF